MLDQDQTYNFLSMDLFALEDVHYTSIKSSRSVSKNAHINGSVKLDVERDQFLIIN